jgi:hypothetical protein
MMMEPKHRAHVEYALRRPLTDEELVVVADLASLPPSHLAVIEYLYKRKEAIAAIYYVRAVTNDADSSAVRRFVHNFDEVIAQRDKPTGLRFQQLYESELGRALTADEMVGATSLQAITHAQREVARALAAKDHGVALVYLHDLVPVPYTSAQDRLAFLESLPWPR